MAMRLLTPLLVAATVILFSSGVAMGILHGHALQIARRLHGPASVIWLALIGVHVLVHLNRALTKSSEDLLPTARREVRGATWRTYSLATALILGLVAGVATVPAQHRWVNLRRDDRRDNAAPKTEIARKNSSERRLPEKSLNSGRPKRLTISDPRRMNGAFMEPSGRNRWRPVANRSAYGKEGVTAPMNRKTSKSEMPARSAKVA